MSGIVGSRLNIRGSGVVGKLGTDGQVLTSSGAGTSAVFEAAGGGMSVSDITGATALAVQPASDDEIVFSDAGTLKRLDIKHIQNTPAFHVISPGNGEMANNTEEVIEFGTETYDSDSCYDTGTYRFTPAVAGKYFLYASLRWATIDNAATRLNIGINKNGAEGLSGRNNNTDYSIVSCSGTIILDADDYVDCRGFQNTGSAFNISTGFELSYFGGFRISGVA